MEAIGTLSRKAAVAIVAGLALFALALAGERRLAADEIPGEVWHGAIEREPVARTTTRPASSLTPYEPIGEAETLATLEKIRRAREQLRPCEARVHVEIQDAGRETTVAQTFRVESAGEGPWKVMHSRDATSFIGSDGASLVARVGWSPTGFLVSPPATNDGGPLSLPSWILEPEYVVGVDPSGETMRFEINGLAGELLVATFDVSIETGMVRELNALLMPLARTAQFPIQVRQVLVEHGRPECAAEESLSFADAAPIRYERFPPRAAVSLGPPLEPRR